MQGTLQKQKCGYRWMRIGYADSGFSNVFILIASLILIYLAFWVYFELPDSKWRLINFLVLYFIAAVLYGNLGVWLHEQLHCLAYRGSPNENRTQIFFTRKYLLMDIAMLKT